MLVKTGKDLTFGVIFLGQAHYQSLEELQGGSFQCNGVCNSRLVHHFNGLHGAGVVGCLCMCVVCKNLSSFLAELADLQCRYGDNLGEAMVAPRMNVRTEQSGAQPSSPLTTSSSYETIVLGGRGPGRSAGYGHEPSNDLEVLRQQYAQRRQSDEKFIMESSPILAGHDSTVEHAMRAAARAGDGPAGGKRPSPRDAFGEETVRGGGVSYVDNTVSPVLPSMLQQVLSNIFTLSSNCSCLA